jgi:hypothetical protein
LEAANANVVGGDINGGSFAIDQQLLFRPGLDWWRWGTPVKGLYLAGCHLVTSSRSSPGPAVAPTLCTVRLAQRPCCLPGRQRSGRTGCLDDDPGWGGQPAAESNHPAGWHLPRTGSIRRLCAAPLCLGGLMKPHPGPMLRHG